MSDFWVGPATAPDTYQLVSLLGGGGEGEVWKAVLPLSSGGRRQVAVKISPTKGDDSGHWEQFGHLLRSLSHPGLVRVTDVFVGPEMHREGELRAGSSRYVVMDYIEGVNLREWAAEHDEAPASQRLRLLSMVAAALDEMHSGAATEIPVAHGDVKPSNIVVRADGAAILVDLGLARLADAEGVVGRSAAYAAPELRTPGALATPDSDRYAFAVTTAHVLTGQLPPIGEDGWLDEQALEQLLRSHPLTARRHMLVTRVLTAIKAPPEERPRQLRPWLDAAVESLSQLTGVPAAEQIQPDKPADVPATASRPPSPTPATAAKDDADPPAEVFGPYRLEALLGRGGMGEVYRAVDTNRNRVVALKRLPTALADDPEFQARFRDESALAARLNEPHIIPIHDWGEIDGRLFIDMRLVEGTDLAQLLKTSGALPAGRAVSIVRQVADALDAAHSAGLVHRDVKPGNVLLRTTETDTSTDLDEGHDFAYLVDFGIARALSTTKPGLTGTSGIIGSVTYMAPERFRGASDHRVDIYALGCLLYEALTGQPPFPSTDTATVIHAHLYNPPPQPSHANPALPAALDHVVATAMAKDPGQRYASAGALAAAARAALTSAATPLDAGNADTGLIPTPDATAPVHRPPSRAHRQPPPRPAPPAPIPPPTNPTTAPDPRRRRKQMLAVAAAVLTLAAGIGVLLGLTNTDTDPSPANLAVATEPAQTPGVNPFTPPVSADVPNLPPAPETRGTLSGGTPGLYGGTLRNAECDRTALITFLQNNPDKAAAWASVQNITVADIPGYINQLTPVLLRADTSVTNHGFKDGQATTLQSVLQAGSAVLADPNGTPRARCYCGNPLTPPDPPAIADYQGSAWPQFDQSNLLTVQPHNEQIREFALKDLATGITIYRPAGTSGELDRTELVATTPPPPTPRPAITPPVVKRPAPTPQPPRTCPEGKHLASDGTCVNDKPKPCPEGTHREDGDCVPDPPRCDSKQRLRNGVCEDGVCMATHHLVNGRCVPWNNESSEPRRPPKPSYGRCDPRNPSYDASEC